MAQVKLLSFYLFSVLTLFVSFNLVNCNVPVLLWESSSISDKDDLIPALFQLDSDEFENHVVKKIHQHKPLVVLFLEESLSVEDFSWKDDHGQGSFPQLQNLTSMSAKTEFITSVYDPLASLKDLADSQDYSWVKFDGKKLPTKSRVVLEVRLEDPSSEEDRPELLRRHDSSIADIYSRLLPNYGHIVAVFTGKYSSWVEPDYNRVKRELEGNSTAASDFDLSVKFQDGTYAMVMSSTPPSLKIDDVKTVLEPAASMYPDVRKGVKYLVVVLQDKTRLKFIFTQTKNKWTLDSVLFNDTYTLKPVMDISRPLGSAFTAEKPIEFSGGNVRLIFQNIKVQGFTMESEFGVNPTYYFTYGILMGIFVTTILGIILSWAIIMMMDIKTMDRFDDPKGKTITVAQGE